MIVFVVTRVTTPDDDERYHCVEGVFASKEEAEEYVVVSYKEIMDSNGCSYPDDAGKASLEELSRLYFGWRADEYYINQQTIIGDINGENKTTH